MLSKTIHGRGQGINKPFQDIKGISKLLIIQNKTGNQKHSYGRMFTINGRVKKSQRWCKEGCQGKIVLMKNKERWNIYL